MADEITLERDLDEILGGVRPAEAAPLTARDSAEAIVEPEDEDEDDEESDEEA